MRLGWSRLGKARLGALAYTGAARAMVFTSAGSSLVTIAGTNTKTVLHTALSLTWSPPFTELAADVAAGATQITVTTDAGFERPAPFEIVMGTEVRMVTSKAALVWTVAAASRNTTSEPHFAGGRVYMLPHTIEVTKGAFVKDYTAIAMRTLKTHEMSEGGEIECSWEFWTSDPATWLPPTDAHVRIKDLDGSYFGGLTARPEIVRRSDGNCHITVTARGYIQAAGADGYDDSRIWDAFTPGHKIITDSRDEKCQGLISISNAFVIDGGQSISQPLDGIDQSPRQIWNTILDQGDGIDALDLQVRTDNSGSPNLHLRRRPAAKLIKIPWATVTDVGLAWDVALQHTKVVVRWRDGRVVVQSGAGGITRTLRKDFSSSIDNVDLAYQVANQLLAETSILNAIGHKPIVLEYPKPVYESDGVTEIPHHRIRAGWRAELTGITAWRGDLPIPQFLIADKATDESRYKVTLQLGSLVRDDMDIAAQYAGRQTKRLGSPVSGLIPSFVTPPEGVPTGVASELKSWGASGVDGTKHLGWESIAKDAAISPIWYGLDGGGVAITEGRKLEIPIEVEMWLCGLRLLANNGVGDPPGPASISIDVKKGDFATYPAATTLVGSIAVAGDPESIDFPDDVLLTGVNTMVLLEPGMFLTITVAPGSTALFATLALMERRTEDSSRGATPSTPTVTATTSTDSQGLVTFTVNTNMLCTAQIEYGPDTNYRSKTLISPQPKRVQTIVQAGIPAGFHYKVHVWNADGVHNTTVDQVI